MLHETADLFPSITMPKTINISNKNKINFYGKYRKNGEEYEKEKFSSAIEAGRCRFN